VSFYTRYFFVALIRSAVTLLDNDEFTWGSSHVINDPQTKPCLLAPSAS
jgi:hypothetical protein